MNIQPFASQIRLNLKIRASSNYSHCLFVFQYHHNLLSNTFSYYRCIIKTQL